MKTPSPFRSSLRLRSSSLQLPLLLGALLTAACQGAETHDLGFTQVSSDLTGADPWSESTMPFFTSYDDFVGHWVGEAEDALALAPNGEGRPPLYHFPSGSTRFSLDLERGTDRISNLLVIGKLTFGAGTPPPPPTDPELGYPVGTNYAGLLSYGGRDAGLPNNLDSRFPPFEAFPYYVDVATTLADPNGEFGSFPGVADGVLPLRFTTTEIIDAWCQLQTPELNPYGVYTAFPAETGSFESRGDGTNALCNVYGDHTGNCPTGTELSEEEILDCIEPDPPVIAQLSCDKTHLLSYCECNQASCRALGIESDGGLSSQLLLRRVGDGLVGAFQNEIFLNARNLTVPMGQVRFERASE
jgi:hypothetical protein